VSVPYALYSWFVNRRILTAALLLCFSVRLLDAQAFEVASVHPHSPGDARFGVKMPVNGQFAATGVVTKLLVMLAYDVQESQIVGGPDWFATDKWDVQAKSGDGSTHSSEETLHMLRSMLEERFGLRIHRETQQRPAYVLTVAKGGPKFKSPEESGSTNYRITRNSISLERGDIARMAQFLSTALGRPVIDQTGLSGIYDLSLQWDDAPVPEGGVPGLDTPAVPGNDRGSIFTAIQDDLGLRLESRRAPVEVIVVDRVERPSEN
jgi:uncharacterized protein (TIGR03435 family)